MGTSDHEASFEEGPRRRKVWPYLALSAPLVLALTAYGSVVKSDRGADAEWARLRKLGVPLSAPEMQGYAQKNGSNAAPDYRLAVAALEEANAPEAEAAAAGFVNANIGVDVTTLRSTVKRFEDAISSAETAADKEVCDYEKDFSRPFDVLYPELSHMKRFAKLLAAKAYVQAADGDVTGAIKTLRRIDRIGVHAGSGPTLISALVGYAILGIGCSAKAEILEASAKNASALASLQAYLEEPVPTPDLLYALKGEAGQSLYGLDQEQSLVRLSQSHYSIDSEDGMQIRDRWRAKMADWAIVRSAVRAKLAEGWRKALEQSAKGGNDWRAMAAAHKNVEEEVELDSSFAGEIVRMLSPIYAEFPNAHGRVLARQAQLQLIVRLLLERARTGELPDSLPDVPEAIDPLTGMSFIYQVKEDGFLIYSVGWDGRDDGGAIPGSKVPPKNPGGRDEGWFVKLR